jgi:hypothetical protein
MTDQEITQEQFNELISDAEYLLDEAEALKYVIDSVPYDESPPDGMSIYNMLKLIDHAQVNYYRPITERVFAENRMIRLSDFEHYKDTFEEVTDKDEMDIQKTLSKIIKHRAAVINVFKRISLIDWERELKGERGEPLILFDLASKMVRDERNILKEIADLVLIYQNERQHQREINKKASQQKSS